MEQYPCDKTVQFWQQCFNVAHNPEWLVCICQLVLELSLSTLVVQPRREKRELRLFYLRMLKASQLECSWKHSRPQRARSFCSALRIATSGLTGFSEHGQSICFPFLANEICHNWRKVRETRTSGVSAHAQTIGSGQRSRFLVLTKKIPANYGWEWIKSCISFARK